MATPGDIQLEKIRRKDDRYSAFECGSFIVVAKNYDEGKHAVAHAKSRNPHIDVRDDIPFDSVSGRWRKGGRKTPSIDARGVEMLVAEVKKFSRAFNEERGKMLLRWVRSHSATPYVEVEPVVEEDTPERAMERELEKIRHADGMYSVLDTIDFIYKNTGHVHPPGVWADMKKKNPQIKYKPDAKFDGERVRKATPATGAEGVAMIIDAMRPLARVVSEERVGALLRWVGSHLVPAVPVVEEDPVAGGETVNNIVGQGNVDEENALDIDDSPGSDESSVMQQCQATGDGPGVKADERQSTDELLQMLYAELSSDEKRMFVDSFCMYLKHDKCKDFVIDLDNVWERMGFSRKDNAKKSLENHLDVGLDFIVGGTPPAGGAKTGSGGHNNQCILMTVDGFKRFCLSAETSKAKQIRDYFITMETVLLKYNARLEYKKQLSGMRQAPESGAAAMEVIPAMAVADKPVVDIRLLEPVPGFVTSFPDMMKTPNCAYIILLGMCVINNVRRFFLKYGKTEDYATRMDDHMQFFPYMQVLCVMAVGDYSPKPVEDTMKAFFKASSVDMIVHVKAKGVMAPKRMTECFRCDDYSGAVNNVLKVVLEKHSIVTEVDNRCGPSYRSRALEPAPIPQLTGTPMLQLTGGEAQETKDDNDLLNVPKVPGFGRDSWLTTNVEVEKEKTKQAEADARAKQAEADARARVAEAEADARVKTMEAMFAFCMAHPDKSEMAFRLMSKEP